MWVLRRLWLRASLTQPVECTGKIVLHDGVVSFVSEHLEGGSIGVDGLFQALGAALPLAQGLKGIAKVVLRRGPIEWHALARTFFKGGSIGVDSLF